MPRGGARPNSGPKVGSKHKATLTKEAALDVLRQVVLAEMRTLIAAQLARARGLSYLVTRDAKTGKFIRITRQTLASTATAIEVWEKEPDLGAFTDLMNRALGKPQESLDLHVKDEGQLVARLLAGRKRAAEGK